MLKTLSLVAAAFGFAAILSAQTAAPGPDTFKVGYFSVANIGPAPRRYGPNHQCRHQHHQLPVPETCAP